jgi:hypothetical protein
MKPSFNCEREIGFTARRRPQPVAAFEPVVQNTLDANRLRRVLPPVQSYL